MKRETLGSRFAKIRETTGLSMLDSAIKCGLAESTVWKVEHDEMVRWETVHLLLVHSFKIKIDSDIYKSMHALWTKDRRHRADHRADDAGKIKAAPHELSAVRKFRKAVRGKSAEVVKKAVAAALRHLK
jgi:transcriptional regulator with XRE-family HTH domain